LQGAKSSEEGGWQKRVMLLSLKNKGYLKDKINELETNSKCKDISEPYRGINEFKRHCQSTINSAKDENSDLLADLHNILKRWKYYFS
jgi:hypothetical protein